jgi:hypothetical protein
MGSTTLRSAAAAALVGCATLALPAHGMLLVSYQFGTSVADQTNAAAAVADHVTATLVEGYNTVGAAVTHSYAEMTPGSMAMTMRRGDDGGIGFRFSLDAQPGYEFQVTGAEFRVRVQNSAGSNRGISVRADDGAGVSLYSSAGGDLTATLSPASGAWNDANWAWLVGQTDLDELDVAIGLKGNSSDTRIYLDWVILEGNVFAVGGPGGTVPESGSLALAAVALLALGTARYRGKAKPGAEPTCT